LGDAIVHRGKAERGLGKKGVYKRGGTPKRTLWEKAVMQEKCGGWGGEVSTVDALLSPHPKREERRIKGNKGEFGTEMEGRGVPNGWGGFENQRGGG